MLLTLLAAVVGQVSASDFFPLIPGSKWTYEYSGDSSGSYNQEVGFPIDVADQKYAPIYIKRGAKIAQTTFYDVQPSTVSVLGHDVKKFFEKPIPVFQLSEKESKWTYEGQLPGDDDSSATISIKGSSKPIGMRDILGEKRLCLEVKTETRISGTPDTATRVVQNSVYAKGVGFAQMDETKTIGKQTFRTKVNVLRFQKPEAGL